SEYAWQDFASHNSQIEKTMGAIFGALLLCLETTRAAAILALLLLMAVGTAQAYTIELPLTGTLVEGNTTGWYTNPAEAGCTECTPYWFINSVTQNLDVPVAGVLSSLTVYLGGYTSPEAGDVTQVVTEGWHGTVSIPGVWSAPVALPDHTVR